MKKRKRVKMAYQFAELYRDDPEFELNCWFTDESTGEYYSIFIKIGLKVSKVNLFMLNLAIIVYLVEIEGARSRGRAGKILPPCTCQLSLEDGGDVICKCDNSLRPVIEKKAFPQKS